MDQSLEVRRVAATRAYVRYTLAVIAIVVALIGLAVYTVTDAQHQRAANLALRIEYCEQLENLKTQNREDVAHDKKNYKRNLRLLHLKDTPELRKAAEQEWARKLKRNAPLACPYTIPPKKGSTT